MPYQCTVKFLIATESSHPYVECNYEYLSVGAEPIQRNLNLKSAENLQVLDRNQEFYIGLTQYSQYLSVLAEPFSYL